MSKKIIWEWEAVGDKVSNWYVIKYEDGTCNIGWINLPMYGRFRYPQTNVSSVKAALDHFNHNQFSLQFQQLKLFIQKIETPLGRELLEYEISD